MTLIQSLIASVLFIVVVTGAAAYFVGCFVSVLGMIGLMGNGWRPKVLSFLALVVLVALIIWQHDNADAYRDTVLAWLKTI